MWILLDWLGYRVASWQLARCSSGFLKLVIGVLLDPGIMMAKIEGKQRLISRPLIDRNFRDLNLAFQKLRIWTRDSLTSPPPSINWLSPSCISSLYHFLWDVLLSRYVYYSAFHQMDKGKVEGMAVELPPLGRLFDTKYQFSQWAYHKASVLVIRLRHRGWFAW